jgi:hypothetical protein
LEKYSIEPKHLLENLTRKQVRHFAYPFSEWNERAIGELIKRDITMAFQFTGRRNPANPAYSIRRKFVAGSWPGKQLYKQMQLAFI